MTESDKIQTKTKQSRLEKLSIALKQNISRRKNIVQKNIDYKETEKNIAK